MNPTDVGASLKVVRAKPATVQTPGAVNGDIVNRTGYLSCVLHVASGAIAGTGTNPLLDAKIQHGDASNLSDAADLAGAAITTITGADGSASVSVNLKGAKKYIRAVVTFAATGGSGNTLANAATLILGGAGAEPTT